MVVKIGNKIRKFRVEAGMTQNDLAKKLKKTQSYIVLLERDYRSVSLNTLEKVAKALDKEIKEFF